MRREHSFFLLAALSLAVLVPAGRAYGETPLFVQQGKLVAEDPVELAQLGFSVAISGDTVVGGAPSFSGPGAAYVFVKSGTEWFQQQKLTSTTTGSSTGFGWSVAVSGDTAVVGSPFETNDGALFSQGAVYVFIRSGTSWSLQQRLSPVNGGGRNVLGISVAISGDTIVAGDLNDYNGVNTGGTAQVFVRNGTNWSFQQKLIPGNPSGNFFGESVALDGDTAVIGDYTYQAGYVCVFTRSGSTWTQQQRLTASETSAGINFGEGVAIDGDTIAVTDPINPAGSVYVFVRDGQTWSRQQTLTTGQAWLGGPVALNGDTILVGARDDAGFAGAAYVFSRSGTSWSQRQQITHSEPYAAAFGLSVALNGDTAAIGSAWGSGDFGAVFTYIPATPTVYTLTADPSRLWPPDHKMKPVTLQVAVGVGEPVPSCAIETVTSNEPITGDIAITDSLSLSLRADRLGSGPGRTYSITVGCLDAFGYQSKRTVGVLVPHDN